MLDQPVFIVGALRSGTTMLRLMLDAHPQICNFGEFEYAFKYTDGNRFPPVDQYVRQLETDRVFLAHGFAVSDGADFEQLVTSFLRQAAERSGKPIVGATIHSRFDLVRKIWPKARFIHLLRDPRDVARSCIGMGWVGNVWYGADIWLDAELRWVEMAESLEVGDYCEIRFEELVASPKTELARICDFLSIDFDDQMLSYPQSSTYDAPDARLANQWKRKLSPDELKWIEAKCAAIMERCGYAVQSDGRRPSLPTQAALWLQNSYARKTFNLRRYGPALYTKWQIAKRLRQTDNAWVRRVLLEKGAADAATLK